MVHSQTKCFSSSIAPLLHKSQILWSNGILRYRPVSIFNGSTPNLICANIDHLLRLSCDRTYHSGSTGFFNVLYVLSFGLLSKFAVHVVCCRAHTFCFISVRLHGSLFSKISLESKLSNNCSTNVAQPVSMSGFWARLSGEVSSFSMYFYSVNWAKENIWSWT